MSSYYQSTLIYGVVLTKEQEEKLYSTIFYNTYIQNAKNEQNPKAEKNFLDIENSGETENDEPMRTILGLNISVAYLDDNIKKIPLDEMNKIINENKPRIIYEIKEFYKEIGVTEIPKLDLYLTAYRY